MSDNIVPLRGIKLKTAAEKQSREMLIDNICALLRRRICSPLDGNKLFIEFKTEAEAGAFQKLIDELPKRKEEYKPKWIREYEEKLFSDEGPGGS